jgi:CSLREA domain-containing protein
MSPSLSRSIRSLLVIWISSLANAALAATISVTTTVDNDTTDGFCSLREAILAANADLAHADCPAGSGADRIAFTVATPATITLAADLPIVTESLAIRGQGIDLLTVSGDDQFEPFVVDGPVDQGAWLVLEDLTVRYGLAHNAVPNPIGGALRVAPGDGAWLSRVLVTDNESDNGGGGIAVDSDIDEQARLVLRHSTVANNSAGGATGGGGILVLDGSLVEIFDSAVAFNAADHANGIRGGILVQRGTVRIERSTITTNFANSSGGGLAVSAAGGDALATIVDSTLVLNQANADGAGGGQGGGIYGLVAVGDTSTVEIENSIVALNLAAGGTAASDIEFPATLLFTSGGTNLIGENGGATQIPAGSPNADDDFVGTFAAPIDPLLLPFEADPGETIHHRPQVTAASPVIDHGHCPGRLADQRGRGDDSTGQRIVDHGTVANHALSDGCDIGAIERGGAIGSNPELFHDGFELGHSLLWTAESP